MQPKSFKNPLLFSLFTFIFPRILIFSTHFTKFWAFTPKILWKLTLFYQKGLGRTIYYFSPLKILPKMPYSPVNPTVYGFLTQIFRKNNADVKNVLGKIEIQFAIFLRNVPTALFLLLCSNSRGSKT